MKIRTCPSCGSADIGTEYLVGLMQPNYKCATCGYTGDIILERDVEKK